MTRSAKPAGKRKQLTSISREELHRLQAKAMTGEDIVRAVLGTKKRPGLAPSLGWRTAHFRPGLTQSGNWRTAVAGDGKGFPDLVLVHDPTGRLIFAECKGEREALSVDQKTWQMVLFAVARFSPRVAVCVWRPRVWIDGTIERMLR